LPRANGGVLCIDELDKFSHKDRQGLLDAMEQGKVKIDVGKISESKLVNSPWKGKHLSEEHKRKISESNIVALKGHFVSEETRKKIGLASKGRKTMLGKHHSNEAKRKIGEASKGRKTMLGIKLSEATKNKISLALKGRRRSTETIRRMSNVRKGTHHTETTKKKISESKKGVKRPCFSDEWLAKISKAQKHNTSNKGRFSVGHIPWSKGRQIQDQYKLYGEKNPAWKGGKKLREAKKRNKHIQKGFILISHTNYDETIEYHHIHPELPYVIPCPKRIHQMFNDGIDNKRHCNNVNAMLGFKLNKVKI